jgi:hypothetical protein
MTLIRASGSFAVVEHEDEDGMRVCWAVYVRRMWMR